MVCPRPKVDARLIERIQLELVSHPAFNEDINTVTGKPHGNTPYADYLVYTWLRREIRSRLQQTGPDPVGAAIDARLGVVRVDGVLRLQWRAWGRRPAVDSGEVSRRKDACQIVDGRRYCPAALTPQKRNIMAKGNNSQKKKEVKKPKKEKPKLAPVSKRP